MRAARSAGVAVAAAAAVVFTGVTSAQAAEGVVLGATDANRINDSYIVVLNDSSAEIYEVVDRFEEIADSLVVGVEEPDGGYWMPLFVVLANGRELPPALVARIRDRIRAEGLAAACAGRGRGSDCVAAHDDGEEGRGSGQTHPPGCCAGQCGESGCSRRR